MTYSAERTLRNLTNLINEQSFSSIDEASKFVKQFVGEKGSAIPSPSDPSSAERAQDLVYDAWGAEDDDEARALALRALEIDPLCSDAHLILARLEESADAALDLAVKAFDAATRSLPPSYFTDPDVVGRFWLKIDTRPYMRARAQLAHYLHDIGFLHNIGQNSEEAIAHMEECLRLNEDDNQGLRFWLGPWYVEANRDDDARKLLRRYADDGSFTAYLALLLEFRKSGASELCKERLVDALKANPFVPVFLLDAEPPPDPEFFGCGDEAEAAALLHRQAGAWAATPGFVDFIFEELERFMHSRRRRSKRAHSYKGLKRGDHLGI